MYLTKIIYFFEIFSQNICCFGPAKNAQGQETLVTVAKCREQYPVNGDKGCNTSDSGAGIQSNLTIRKKGKSEETINYDLYCPCYASDGLNMNSSKSNEHPSAKSGVTKNSTETYDKDDIQTCSDCSSGTNKKTTTCTNSGTFIDTSNIAILLIFAVSILLLQ